jgi:hypothetical protein
MKGRRKAKNNKGNLMLNIERKRLAKEYKKAIRKSYRKYKDNLAKTLTNLKCKNPKAYWNVLNGKKSNNNKMPSCNAFLDMFKELNTDVEEVDEFVWDEHGDINNVLNEAIVVAEVENCIKKLKNNKACGLDNILNEFLKVSANATVQLVTKLFNLVLLTGIVPNDWSVGVIKPIYKSKGAFDDPNNYRGITILSCLGKLFTSVLDDRIKTYLDSVGLLGEEQAGFRGGFSTTDHIFTLYGIIDILLYKRKRLHCAFLDYEKAFDKVNRTFLWQKMLIIIIIIIPSTDLVVGET